MKNQISFIPQNISAISNISQRPHINSQSVTLNLQDSTDNLMQQILKQRAQRLKLSNQKIQTIRSDEFDQNNQNELGKQKRIKNVYNSPQTKIQSLSKLSQNKIQKQRDFLEQKIQKTSSNHTNLVAKNNQTQNNQQINLSQQNQFTNLRKKSSKQQNPTQQKEINQNTKLEPVKSKIKSNKSHSKIKNSGIQIPVIHYDHNEQSYEVNDHALIQQTNKIPISNLASSMNQHIIDNQSQQKIQQNDYRLQKSKSKEISYHQDYQSFNKQKQSINGQNESKQLDHFKKEPSKIVSKQQSSKSNSLPEQLKADQFKIQMKYSEIKPQQNSLQKHKQYLSFPSQKKNNETDEQLVNAISQQMNFINKIQNYEYHQQNIIKSSKNLDNMDNQNEESIHKISKSEILQGQAIKGSVNNKDIIKYQQFDTQYSQGDREIKILQHRNQSNIQFQIDQLKQLIALYQASIVKQQLNQTLKFIKDLQMKNRALKIQLRSASYTKRFNFHSPIIKNNQRPLEFIKKFKVSPNLANEYYTASDNIKKQKMMQLDLQQKAKLLNDYYELMKNKQIKSYGQTLTAYEYNEKLQRYQLANNNNNKNLITTSFKKDKKSQKYEFDKSNKKIQVQNQEVQYYQFLKNKIDINKDMILEFQVYQMNKIKRLKDQNRIIKKQIQIVDDKIHKVHSLFVQLFGNINKTRNNFSPSLNNTRNKMTSQQSLSSFWRSDKEIASPNKISRNSSSKSKNFIQINRSIKHRFQKSPAKVDKSMTKMKNNYYKNQLETLLINSVQFNGKQLKNAKKQQISDVRNTLLINSIQKASSNIKRFVKQAQHNDYGVQSIIYEAKQAQEMPTLIKKEQAKPQIARKSTSRNKNLVRPNIKKIKSQQNLGKKDGINSFNSSKKSNKKQVISEYYINLDDN